MNDTSKKSEVVYSTDDPCALVRWALERHGRDVDPVIRVLAPPENCSYSTARITAEAFAHCLGLTPDQFMIRWDTMRYDD